MDKSKEEIMKFKEVTKDQLNARMLQDLKMIYSYLGGFIQKWECKQDRHEFDEWSVRLCGNVSENNLVGVDSFSYRACQNCGQEMEKSRIYHKKGTKEENARTYKESKL